jgi:Xaa-Pro aminopeptidase
MDLKAIQKTLQERGLDAWLFYDHHHRDPIAYSVLGLPASLHVTRRWYYLIPAQGEPQKLVHRIESFHLDPLPGTKHAYFTWQEQHELLKNMLAPHKNIAMQYSAKNLLPAIGLVDAGTIELVRSFGKEIVSSGDLVALFEAVLSEAQIATHYAARDLVDPIMEGAFKRVRERLNAGRTDEFEIQQWIMEAFRRERLITDNPPVVGVNAKSGDPHYCPSSESSNPIREGDFLLIDMWAKQETPGAVYYDITWTGYIGKAPSTRQQEVFEVVRDGRDAGIKCVQEAFAAGRKICGWEVDKATRDAITGRGFGQYFVHRTGHNIGSEVHGNGANIDSLETQDDRQIIPNTCFSIEPGVYLPEFGIRAEIDIMTRPGKAEVTGKIQRELVRI